MKNRELIIVVACSTAHRIIDTVIKKNTHKNNNINVQLHHLSPYPQNAKKKHHFLQYLQYVLSSTSIV